MRPRASAPLRISGAHDQIRTGDLVLTKDALCRLSYVGVVSNQAKSAPASLTAPGPVSSSGSLRRSGWSGRRDSNPRHPAWKAGALPAELRPPRSPFPVTCSPRELRPSGGEGRIRTFEGPGPSDLQSDAFDRFATSPPAAALANSRAAPAIVRLARVRGCGWSWRRELNPRPADYKSAALPLSYASDKRRV